MENKIKEIKGNILLAFSILLLLFTICIIIYKNNTPDKSNNMHINTNLSFDGGTDRLSQELQYIIPYVTINNPQYLTAYQNKKVTIKDIANEILLTKGYFNNMKSNTFSIEELSAKISDLYGQNIFIINQSFNVNGKNSCIYEDFQYNCQEEANNEKLYKADREIMNVNISDSYLYLTENILFYSEETVENVTYYNVYNNGLYEKIIFSFDSNNLINENMDLTEYISNYLEDKRVLYQSSFIINNNKYNWVETINL